jgi:hypothetical protein
MSVMLRSSKFLSGPGKEFLAIDEGDFEAEVVDKLELAGRVRTAGTLDGESAGDVGEFFEEGRRCDAESGEADDFGGGGLLGRVGHGLGRAGAGGDEQSEDPHEAIIG